MESRENLTATTSHLAHDELDVLWFNPRFVNQFVSVDIRTGGYGWYGSSRGGSLYNEDAVQLECAKSVLDYPQHFLWHTVFGLDASYYGRGCSSPVDALSVDRKDTEPAWLPRDNISTTKIFHSMQHMLPSPRKNRDAVHRIIKGHLWLAKPLCRLLLRLRREVFDLGLSKNDVRVGGRALVHIRLGDDEQNVLAFLDRNAHNGRDSLHAELLYGLTCLLFVTVLLSPLGLERFEDRRREWR